MLAVTHLPQVAACADHHLVVSKQLLGKTVSSSVAPVQGDARVGEVARMLGGDHLVTTSQAHARQMLGLPGKPQSATQARRPAGTKR